MGQIEGQIYLPKVLASCTYFAVPEKSGVAKGPGYRRRGYAPHLTRLPLAPLDNEIQKECVFDVTI